MNLKTVLGIVVAVAVIGACHSTADRSGDDHPAGKTLTVVGELKLADYAGITGTGHGCTGWQGYDDVAPGAQAVVTDADGKKVGVGTLGPGTWGGGRSYCTFTFVVSGVPAGGGPYSVEVAHRGEVSFVEADADHLQMVLR